MSRATKTRPVILDVPRFAQPDEVSCGPTSLAQVYHFYKRGRPLDEVIRATPRNPDGGTQAVYLGITALRDDFKATIYPYNLRVFDPTWRKLGAAELIGKLNRRLEVVRPPKLRRTTAAYIEYLESGGKVRFAELTERLLVRILRRAQPILTGLSATYLYRTPRERDEEYDDVSGEPVGHFVVVCGYYPKTRRFVVSDPSTHIPFSRSGRYSVGADRLIPAILLGELTYDSVLLIVTR